MKIKKYILLMAAAAMGLWSCQSELEKVTLVDPSQVVAPVLHQLPEEITITADNMSDEVVFEWEKADFGQRVQYAYSIYATTGDDASSLVTLYSNISGTSQATSFEKFNQIVTTKKEKGGLGLPTGTATEVTFFVGATVGTNYQTFYSNGCKVLVTPTEAEREYEMVWLPGSANGWNHAKANHLFCYAEDGNTFVGVTDFGADFASNQFKLTGAAGWDDATGNWGMADPSAAPESASITLLNGSNDNITIYTAHRFYHFTFTKANLGLTKDAGFDKVGVIGLNGDWDNDIVMDLSAKQIFYVDIDVASDTEFKFRLDGGWDVNWGGDMEGLSPGGDNIPVAAGQYRVYLNLNDWSKPTARLDASMYGKPEDEPEPEPEPDPITGWNIIGLNGDWDNDIIATQNGNVWSAFITAKDETTFKWRKDGGWDENYGGTLVSLGEPFEAVAGGGDIKVSAGFYKVELDTEKLTITVSNGEIYSLIGQINGDSWSKDVEMTFKDGVWTSPVVTIDGGFKIRHNFSWADEDCYGLASGEMAEVGKEITLEQPGADISLAAGDYKVQFNPESKKMLISSVAFPEQLYMIGDEFGGWDWGSDGVVEMTPVIHKPDWGAEAEAQFWTIRYFTADKGFKFNSKKAWGGDFWGLTENDGFVEKEGNCTVAEDGFYLVHIDLKNEKVHVEPARVYGIGACFGGWDAAMEGALFQTDGKTLKATAQADGELRMYAESAISTSDWWTREFIILDGVIDYRGDDEGQGDQERVKIQKGQVVSLNFNAGTGSVDGEGEDTPLPETMYIIGDGVGGWDWATNAVDMIPVNGKAGQFWAIRYIENGKGFKFCAQKAWSGDFYSLGEEDSGFTVSDNNCFVAEKGVYMIYVDTENKKICVEPAKVYGIGDCFGGWDAKMEGALFTATEDGKLVGTTKAAGQIRLYAESTAATSDWWTREFVFFEGKIAYRGNGGDQERVTVDAGKKVTLDFNAGTAVVE